MGVLRDLMTAIGDVMRAMDGLNVYDFPPDRIEPPAAVLSMPETGYDVTLGGRNDQWTFPLWILIGKADDKAGHSEMLDYLEAEGDRSVRAALEADRTLNGACDTLAIILAQPMYATIAGTEYLAIQFTLEVYT